MRVRASSTVRWGSRARAGAPVRPIMSTVATIRQITNPVYPVGRRAPFNYLSDRSAQQRRGGGLVHVPEHDGVPRARHGAAIDHGVNGHVVDQAAVRGKLVDV